MYEKVVEQQRRHQMEREIDDVFIERVFRPECQCGQRTRCESPPHVAGEHRIIVKMKRAGEAQTKRGEPGYEQQYFWAGKDNIQCDKSDPAKAGSETEECGRAQSARGEDPGNSR